MLDSKTKMLARNATLTAMALALSAAERLFGLQLLMPIPGAKVGLSNIVTLYALIFIDAPSALLILISRIIIGSLFFGGAAGFLYSLTGGFCAFIIMFALSPLYPKRVSLLGLSVAGAAAHSAGQIAAASVLSGTAYVFAYLPLLLLVSVPMGLITGGLVFVVARRTSKKL